MVYLGDVIDPKTALAGRNIGVFAAYLYLKSLGPSFIFVGLFELAAVVYEVVVIILISQFVEVAAINGLGLGVFGNSHRFECILGSDVDVPAHEVDEVCALQ